MAEIANTLEAPGGRLGISICYDVEFMLMAGTQVEAGARTTLAAWATDSMQGYWHAGIGAQAQAPTVGMGPWAETARGDRKARAGTARQRA